MKLDFSKSNGLIPAIIQDANTHKVLMLGYMDEDALKKTKAKKRVTFYSRSKKRLWTKGETSGNFLHVVDILKDCDKDTLLIKVNPDGPACHTGADTCFKETNQHPLAFLTELAQVIRDRKKKPSGNSYTSRLFKRGINKIAQKVGEEAVELIIEAKDEEKELFVEECGDLLYHLLVLLEAKGVTLEEVVALLKSRNKEVGKKH